MRRAVLALLTTTLSLPAAAAAHVTIAPPFVSAGVPTEISMTVPNERPPNATVGLEATMPTGVAIVSASSPDGWNATLEGATVSWSGGRIEGRSGVVFSVRIEADVRAGTYPVTARQRYDDGADVRWTTDLSVLPASGTAAPDQRPWPAIVIGVVGLAVVAGSLLVLRRLRR